QGYGKLAKLAGDFRDEVKTKIATLTGRRQFWERAFEGEVSQLMFAGNEDAAAARLQADLDNTASAINEKSTADNTSTESHTVKNPMGEVYIVGAGPGDPELLTFKALRLMQQADIVYYDALRSEERRVGKEWRTMSWAVNGRSK